MKLVLLGPPGAGKGTHAKKLGGAYGLRHLATGDILRQEIRGGTELGGRAKGVIEKGGLVSDDLINEMMAKQIESGGADKGFLLDGYPRTINQAEALDVFLKHHGIKIDAVINFVTSEQVVIDRLSGRRVCAKCGGNFHVHNIPPKKEGICDFCGDALVQRKDDKPETVRHRLETYRKETSPLIEYYRQQGLLHDFPADQGVEPLQVELRKFFEKAGLVQ
ncbi:MAG: adenylate kinase [Candidatus Omnitrophota bacterium]|jgi:adenylate kinase